MSPSTPIMEDHFRMRSPAHTRPAVLAATLLTLALPLTSHAAAGESLEARLRALLGNPQIKTAQVSMEIVEVLPGRAPPTLFAYNANTPLGPASNCKILTTAAAFEKYGPKAAFKTLLYKVGDDLVLVGGGDPAFGDAKLAGAHDTTPTAAFEQWAEALKAQGITRYNALIIDDRIFDTEWVHPHWPADQRLNWYSAPIGGLNFNANCLDWIPKLSGKDVSVELIPDTSYVTVTNKASRGSQTRVSLLRPPTSNNFDLRGTVAASATTPFSVPIYDPGLWTGTILKDILARAGITATSATPVRRAQTDERFGAGALVASHETPLLHVIQRANTNSVNMMAEGLCKRLGYDSTGGKQPGSWANGTAAVEAYITGLGVKADTVSLDDGSGLSNKNRASAHAFTTVLAHVAARPDGQQFIDTLANPGEDGTLIRRFKNLSVADHVQAKTGHISGVSTLSGYVRLPESAPGRPRLFAFSILCNKYQGNVNPWQDQVCQALYDWAIGK
jgi:D-alanyl-D-alanine carboxypeptidase/D-alanyl-D-alanine-endopeptidase (penicillin-binding protein 4)